MIECPMLENVCTDTKVINAIRLKFLIIVSIISWAAVVIQLI